MIDDPVKHLPCSFTKVCRETPKIEKGAGKFYHAPKTKQNQNIIKMCVVPTPKM